ncbi:MAG TPA: hypothetical protein VGM47_01295 [Gammaproteobacteria bacterium]|jgi:hypothetical protein
MRILVILIATLCLGSAWAEAPQAPAASGRSPAPAAASATHLGEIHVQGLRSMVEVLQQMKTAIDAPFDNDPKHYDDMVCRITDNDGFRAQGAILECGTQGWFGMYRYQQHGASNPISTDLTSTPTTSLGHPWHIERLLNHEQLAALRTVLGKLPLPGKGEVQIVDDANPPTN